MVVVLGRLAAGEPKVVGLVVEVAVMEGAVVVVVEVVVGGVCVGPGLSRERNILP